MQNLLRSRFQTGRSTKSLTLSHQMQLQGEALELPSEHVWQAPQQQLLGGLAVLSAPRTVPSLLRCRHPRLHEEVQALVQSEEASTGSLPTEAGSSAHSSSLEASNTNPCGRSLFRQPQARPQSSPSSSGISFVLQRLLSTGCITFIVEALGCVN